MMIKYTTAKMIKVDTRLKCVMRNSMTGLAIIDANPNPIIANPVAIPRLSGNHFTNVDTGAI